MLATLVDAVDATRATLAEVPGGGQGDGPVAVITLDKYLPGQRPEGMTSGSGQNLSVAQ